MKLKIERDHFSNGLQQVLNVVGTRASMPILSNVLLQAGENTLALTTTNMDMAIRCTVEAKVSETGAATLNVRRLATVVRELQNNEVQLTTAHNQQATLSSGGSTFKFNGIAPEEFPAMPEFPDSQSYTINQSTLLTMLRGVAYAQSTDESRYILNGVFFDFRDQELSLVATDGRRLAKISREVEMADEQRGQVIVPAKTVGELMRLLEIGENVKIAFNERRVSFRFETRSGNNAGFVGDIDLVSKVVEGSYPNYQQVIPKETEHRIKLERELLLQCVRRAALMTSDKSSSIKFFLSNNLLEIKASSPEVGEANETMAITYEGPDIQIAFNPQYAIDPLRAVTKDEVFFEVKDDISPGVIKTLDSFLCVIMPVRMS